MNFPGRLKLFRQGSLLWLLVFLAACGGDGLPTAVPTVALPTAPAPTVDVSSALTAVPLATETAEIEIASTNTAVPPTAPPAATPLPTQTAVPAPTTATSNQTSYSVIFVEPNDVLNVRSGPGVNFGIVGTLPPTVTDVQITGSGQVVSGSTWVPVQRGAVAGWVNSRFLSQTLANASFCGNATVLQLLDRLETAVANQDDTLFAQLIHPERGLRVRLLWHEAETLLDNQGLLSDATSYNWGNAAGSGEAIVGTPAQVLLPRLQTDFLAATETACNEILHGGTAGFVVLPDAYASLNYYAFYRPGTDEFAGLNWGSWVVGVELWQGQYYLSSLVHYQWEP